MNFLIKTQAFSHDILFRVGKLRKVLGANSTLENGKHILMWEFDHVEAHEVTAALLAVQMAYNLPNIHVLTSSEHQGFHAYCLAQETFPQSVAIVASTPLVDWDWVRMCVNRGHWTLRLTDKGNGAPETIMVLHSNEPDEVAPTQITSGVLYEAWERGRNHHAG